MSNLVDETISIVGPRQLQNELIASFLKSKTTVKCIIGKDMDHVIGQYGKDNHKPMLIFMDCMEKDADSCLALLKPEDEQMFSRHFVALFNVGQGLGIEERAF